MTIEKRQYKDLDGSLKTVYWVNTTHSAIRFEEKKAVELLKLLQSTLET